MKYLIFMLMSALCLSLTGCTWFDSSPVEPEIIGAGRVVKTADSYYVEIDSLRYEVKIVYTGEKNQSGAYIRIYPDDNMLVTAINFKKGNVHTGGSGTSFMLGDWNSTEKIEDTFKKNYTFSAVACISFIYFFIYVVQKRKKTRKF